MAAGSFGGVPGSYGTGSGDGFHGGREMGGGIGKLVALDWLVSLISLESLALG